ncbi:hypothetical protein QN412_21155 [Pseudomonas sp. RTB3]|nr:MULTISPECIES: hypothetical protein [unclassified Pseudomonas]MEB0007253.1 hypothetical protein [Pseudomonas sp. RTB2]MEB0019436.1 hypothetical protein [Pseudomonas sp. RTB3]MEB0270407.1 hypothetical protein [Pseudomonas sp. 5B4]
MHQLIEDIDEQIDAGSTREYFIGTVLVSPTRRTATRSSMASSV